MQSFRIRSGSEEDQDWILRTLNEHWGAARIVTRGIVHEAERLPALIAEMDNERVGLITYRFQEDQCEVISLNSLRESIGIGTALLDAVKDAASKKGCRRLWLITTNDNLAAVRFYQKRGWTLVAVHRGAIAESRKLKPTIPEIGIDGIPIRDEIELELPL
jgi:ribosomal protein S18 acetylase RimI-like enzyme